MPELPHEEWLRRRQAATGIFIDDLAPALLSATGSIAGAHRAQQRLGGHSSVVFELPRPDGVLFLRAKLGPGKAYEAEAWARRELAAVGVPAPEILGLHHEQRGDQWLSVSVERKAPGLELGRVLNALERDSDRSRMLSRAVGAMMARMHAVQPEGFGPLDGEGRGRYATYTEHLADSLTRALTQLREYGYPRDRMAAVERAADVVLAGAALLDPPRPSLVHMDPGADHWFVAGDEVVGLIDLESVEGADPVRDLAWWDYWRDWDLPHSPVDELIAGYADKELLRPADLQMRLRLARLTTGVTTLAYFAVNDRPDTAARAFEVLTADLDRPAATSAASPRPAGRGTPGQAGPRSSAPRT